MLFRGLVNFATLRLQAGKIFDAPVVPERLRLLACHHVPLRGVVSDLSHVALRDLPDVTVHQQFRLGVGLFGSVLRFRGHGVFLLFLR